MKSYYTFRSKVQALQFKDGLNLDHCCDVEVYFDRTCSRWTVSYAWKDTELKPNA